MCICNLTFRKHQAACRSQYLALRIKVNANQSGGNWTHRLIMRGSISAAHRQHYDAFCKRRLIKMLSVKYTNKGCPPDVSWGEINIMLTNLKWVPTMQQSSFWVTSQTSTMAHCVQSSWAWRVTVQLQGSFLSLLSAETQLQISQEVLNTETMREAFALHCTDIRFALKRLNEWNLPWLCSAWLALWFWAEHLSYYYIILECMLLIV